MTRKQKRLLTIGSGLAVLACALFLVLFALRQQIVFFRTPADLVEMHIASGVRIRLGGLVENGSIVRDGSTKVKFTVTDTISTLPVTYEGILPDLFREGQGVIAEGAVGPDGVFVADTILAKHDENYMPKDVADSLKAKGVWQGR